MVATGVDVLPESLNVIPDQVTVTLDWRTLPTDDEAGLIGRVEEKLRPHLERRPHPGMQVEVRVAAETQRAYTGVEEPRSILSPGFLMDPGSPLVLAATRAVGRRDDPETPALSRPWTFATDGGWTCGVRGIPTIGFAPGEERHAHTNRERLDLAEAEWAYGRYLDLVLAAYEAVSSST